MAVTAIHQRTRRGPSSLLRSASLLLLVVAWAAVFGVAYTLGSKPASRATSAQAASTSLAKGSSLPAGAARAIRAPSRSGQPPVIAGLRQLPAPPALRPVRVSSRAVALAPVYSAPSQPVAPAHTPTTTPTPTPPTGGGPHGSGGTGGGTTTVGGGNSGGGGVGTPTTPTGTTPTPTTPTGATPSGG